MNYETILLHEAVRLLLISIRQQRRYTQRSLSIESGISRQFISQLECGTRLPSIDTLSQLAIALKQEGNVLLLDEPTNDIDVNTLRALEEGLDSFAGCAVIISHDRWFLDRICTHILAFEGDGEVFWFEGSYTDYEANKAKRLGLEEPKRIRYRKLMDD